jgi:pSer/pThr/pTyr-binding forkhead associated (FHA) protein
MPTLRAFLPDGHTRDFPVTSDSVTIGRDAPSDIAVGSPTMSRVHARLAKEAGFWMIADNGSRNGVRLDGRLVAKAPVGRGTRFKLGKVEFELVEDGGEAAPAAATAAPADDPAPEAGRAEDPHERDTDAIDVPRSRTPLLIAGAGVAGLAVAAGVFALITGLDPAPKPARPAPARVTSQKVTLPDKAPAKPSDIAEEKPPEPAFDPEKPREGEMRVRFRDGTARVGVVKKRTDFEIEVSFLEGGAEKTETWPIEAVLRIGTETVRPDWNRIFKAKLASAKGTRAALVDLDAWCVKHGWDKGRREIAELLADATPVGDDTKKPDLVPPGKTRFAGSLRDTQELRAEGKLDARGRLVPSSEDLRFIREAHFDLIGRSPRPAEVQKSAAESRAEMVRRLSRSVEHYEAWFDDELYYFLLLENFRPATPRMLSIPRRLAEGALTVPDAIHEIVISQYFNHRNPGNDTYVTVVFEQLLGMVVQDQPMLLKVGKQMYDGYEGKVFNLAGASQSDLVYIVRQQKRFHEMLLERLHLRYTGEAIAAPVREAGAARVMADARAFPDVVGEWLLNDDYASRASKLRRKSDHQFIRSIYVDLLDRAPTYEEFRLFRNALQALADPTPIRSVLAKVMVDSDSYDPGKIGNAKEWVTDQFEKFLGRRPNAQELDTFSAAAGKGKAKIVIQAIVDSIEYQHY